MNSQDRRALRTNKLMADALINISTDKNYDAITIRDIVDSADIAYSTFFQHYKDKDALLRDIASEAIATINNVIEKLPIITPLEVGKLIFNHVIEHEALYCIFLSGQGVNQVFKEIQDDLRKMMLSSFSQKYANTNIPPEIAVNHILSSIFALIKWWLDHDKPYSIDQMASIYDMLIMRATHYAINTPIPMISPSVICGFPIHSIAPNHKLNGRKHDLSGWYLPF